MSETIGILLIGFAALVGIAAVIYILGFVLSMVVALFYVPIESAYHHRHPVAHRHDRHAVAS